MKKTVTMILAAVLAMGVFAGCNSNPAETPDPSTAITSKEDLVNKKIGVQEGTTGDLLATDIEGSEVARFKKAVDAAMELKTGRIDAVILDELPAKEIVKKNSDLKILDEKLSEEDYAIAVPKENSELMEAANATLKRIKEDGTYDLIYKAYIEGDEEAQKQLAEKPAPSGDSELVMGTNAEFPPFEYRDDNNQIVGFDVEVAKEIARDMGKTLVVEDMAFDSLIIALKSGKIQMILAGMTVTEERQQSVDFSDPYHKSTQVIIVKK